MVRHGLTPKGLLTPIVYSRMRFLICLPFSIVSSQSALWTSVIRLDSCILLVRSFPLLKKHSNRYSMLRSNVLSKTTTPHWSWLPQPHFKRSASESKIICLRAGQTVESGQLKVTHVRVGLEILNLNHRDLSCERSFNTVISLKLQSTQIKILKI